MAHHAPTVKPADDPAFKLPTSLSGVTVPVLIGGLAAIVVGWAVATFGNGTKVGMSAYLTAFTYGLTLALGCLFFVMIQHLVRAGWSVVVRRVAELYMVMLVPLAILFLPIAGSLIFGGGSLYVWNDPGYAAEHHLPADIWRTKLSYLNTPFFLGRAVLYFVAWIAMAVFFYRGSTEQDETGQLKATERMQYWAGPAVMAFALITSFAAFDWVMSLAPMWFSTMFGVYLFAGSILAAHCLITVTSFGMQKAGAMRDEVTVEHYHDLGKLICGFTLFWTYISFSQYLLIWYGNIPEETEWIYHRQIGTWGVLSVVLIFFHWLLPFMGTMAMAVRRRPWAVTAWAGYLLVMHFLDVYWAIMPEAKAGAGTAVNVLGVVGTVICTLGVAAMMFGLAMKVAEGVKLVPVRDPRLPESLAFENV